MFGRLEETQMLSVCFGLFKHQNYTTRASRAQGMAAGNAGGEFQSLVVIHLLSFRINQIFP